MNKFKNYNLRHIQQRFQGETGVLLEPLRCPPSIRGIAVVAAVLSLFVLSVAFTYSLFSPLDGDALSMRATYEGDGIVTISVENRSFKKLELQPQLKLVSWITGEEVTMLSDRVSFNDTTIAPHSTETITVDISRAYDIAQLEDSLLSEWYYLLLTNHNFMYGQEWRCSVYFGAQQLQKPERAEPLFQVDEKIVANVLEELQFYFEDDYYGIFAGNPLHYEYLQTAQELLMRSGKRIVEPSDPLLFSMPAPDGVIFDETYPAEKQYSLSGASYSIRDEFGKLVGFAEEHSLLKQTVFLSSEEGEEDSSWALPILYYGVYELAAIESFDDYAFIYGQLVTFRELEPFEVYRDEEYVCYDVTHLIYTDLRSYVEEVVAMDPDYYCFDEQCWVRIKNVYDYYKANQKLLSLEDWLEICPDANIDGIPDHEDLRKVGLSGILTSNMDMKKIVITIEERSEEELIYEEVIVPEDPRYYDLSNAEKASKVLYALEEGCYVFNVTVWLDSDIMSCQSVWECVVTSGNASVWSG